MDLDRQVLTWKPLEPGDTAITHVEVLTPHAVHTYSLPIPRSSGIEVVIADKPQEDGSPRIEVRPGEFEGYFTARVSLVNADTWRGGRADG